MRKIYQKVIDSRSGDCLRAAVCSLIGISDRRVPNFITVTERDCLKKFLGSKGYSYDYMILLNPNVHNIYNPTGCCEGKCVQEPSLLLGAIKNHEGVDGLFVATVFSPRYFDYQGFAEHAVVIDKNFNVVHDPNPAYKDIASYPLSPLIGYNGIVRVYIIKKKYHKRRKQHE